MTFAFLVCLYTTIAYMPVREYICVAEIFLMRSCTVLCRSNDIGFMG